MTTRVGPTGGFAEGAESAGVAHRCLSGITCRSSKNPGNRQLAVVLWARHQEAAGPVRVRAPRSLRAWSGAGRRVPRKTRRPRAPHRGQLTCSRWLLTRCMLSAGLLGRIFPQPRTVHRILVRTARDSSLTDGWISSRAGGTGTAAARALAGRGRLP